MKTFLTCLFLSAVLFVCGTEQIRWQSREEKDSVRISVTLGKKVSLHRDQTLVEAFAENGKKIFPSEEPSKVTDYAGPGSFIWKFDGHPAKIHVQYQGCTSDGICFLPEEKTFYFDGTRNVPSGNQMTILPSFEIIRRSGGYRNAEDFLNFLKGEKQDSGFAGKSVFMIFLLTFLGGILLNLTPCVLPMIPVNLAIIGAKSGSWKMRLLRGMLYGGGITVAYGVLGVVVILTGSIFGEFASSWYFNAGAGVIFIFLGLSLFDLFFLDFSRYKTKFSFLPKTHLIGVFAMGALSAVLAGACVAPVAVSALLQGGKMYQEGAFAGLFLPFVLGLGMALPWPAAAAGMTVLPKPGKWMNVVKYVFGVLICGIGVYYLWTAYGIFRLSGTPDVSGREQLAAAVKESAKSGKKVLIVFHAQWCKNCHAMSRTTLRDTRVLEEMKQFLVVKFDATAVTSPEVKGVLKQFDVHGLPAYVILRGK